MGDWGGGNRIDVGIDDSQPCTWLKMYEVLGIYECYRKICLLESAIGWVFHCQGADAEFDKHCYHYCFLFIISTHEQKGGYF